MNHYGTKVSVPLPFAVAVEKTREALKSEGFGVITEIDVQRTMKDKLNKDMNPYIVLGACQPEMAYAAIRAEPEMGLLIPCNVCIWGKEDGTSEVAAIDAKVLFGLVQNPRLETVAETVNDKLIRAIDRVKTHVVDSPSN